MGQTLVVTERSTAATTESVFRALETSEMFLALIDSGAVSLLRSKSVPYGVRAGAQVGQAVLENSFRLIIEEKIRGSLIALLNWALPQDLREADALAPVAANSPVLGVFASRFLDYLGEYLRHGRMKEYVRRPAESSYLRGRLDSARTARLLARGIRGRLAYRQSELVADIDANRLLSLGLSATDALSSTLPASGDRLQEMARVYSPLFEDVDVYQLARVDISRRTAVFRDVLEDPRIVGDLRSALAYARALVLYLGAWPAHVEEILPHAYFINLESLFEDAARQVITELIGRGLVSQGRDRNQPLFEERPEQYLADPDIVLGFPTVTLVADCKYKEVQEGPEHADVYQLMAHCGAFGCRLGLLLYPGEEPVIRRLGTVASRTELWWAAVRPASLKQDLASVLHALNIGYPQVQVA